MTQRKLLAALGLVLAVAALGAVPAALAQAQARVRGVVRGPDGEPAAGVQMTLTDPTTGTKITATTDEKGRYSVILLDATKTYTYRFEKEGLQPFEEAYKAPIGSNVDKDFQFPTPEAVQQRAVASGELSPQERAVVVFNEGAQLAREGQDAAAKEKFLAAVELDPELSSAHSALAAMHAAGGDHAAAAAAAERALALDPGDVNALRTRYNSYRELGDEAKTAAALAALEAASPESRAESHFNQGVDAFNGGDMATARTHLEETIAADPQHAKAHYLLGLVLVNAGENAPAREHLEKFLELAPEDADAETARQMLGYL